MGARGKPSAASLAIVALSQDRVPSRRQNNPAPRHLSAEAKGWWASVTTDYEVEPHHLRLLQAACEAWDRAQLAREAVAKEGITFRDSSGNLKAHPAVAIERDARTLFARLVRELDLDADAPSERRPPALQSNRRGNA